MEESNIERKAEAIQLCKMLLKPENERMPFEGVEIAKSLQRVTFLSKFFDMRSEQFINLCITSSIVEFNPNTDIYSKETNRYIYIILEGQVKVSLKNKETEIFEPSKHYLSEFGIFGETEILFGLDERKEIINTESKIVKCMVFEENSIKKIISPKMIDFAERSFKYLHVSEYFEELSEFEKQQLVSFLSLKLFSKADCIIETEKEINFVLFFVYGRVSVVKEMALKNSIKKESYKIDELSEMDSFGEYECYNKKLSSYSLVAESTGAYYMLDCKALKNSNHKILEIIKEQAIPYPDEEELGFLHSIEYSIKLQEEKVVKKNKLF